MLFIEERMKNFNSLLEGYNVTRFPKVSRSDLTEDDVSALRTYGSQYYSTPMNNALWHVKLMNNQHGYNRFAEHRQLHDSVISALNKFPASREDNFVYTGLSKHANPEKWSEGGLVYIPAFISTSYDSGIPRGFADVHGGTERTVYHANGNPMMTTIEGGYMNGMKIKIPAGISAGGSIRNFTGIKEEKEYLIKPHQILQITGAKTIIKPKWEHWADMRYYHARILTPNEIEENADHPEVKRMLAVKRRLNI